MIGRYLESLTPEQEDRVLTEHLGATDNYIRSDGCRCLMGVTQDAFRLPNENIARFRAADANMCSFERAIIGIAFDDLCKRFGEPRVNAVIRNRVLANRARRMLTITPETVFS